MGMSGAAARTGKFKIKIVIENNGIQVVCLLKKTQQGKLRQKQSRIIIIETSGN